MPRLRRSSAGRLTISRRVTQPLASLRGWGQWRSSWSAQPRAAMVIAAVLVIATLSSVGLLGGAHRLLFAGGDALTGADAQAHQVATPTPPLPPIPYAHSWYIDDHLNTPDAMVAQASRDAAWLTTQAQQPKLVTTCPADFLTVLDFGHPTRAFTGHASPLDDYAMSFFGKQESWRTYRQVERLAESYVDAWAANAASCVQLHLVLGTSNFNECGKAVGACDVHTAGQYWDVVVHDLMDYVATKHYAQVTAVWVGDDLEASWDPWTTTLQFLEGVRDQERTYAAHAHLVDYGDAQVGACSEVTGRCVNAWTAENVYAAAWGIGWDLPIPETYNATTTQRWKDVAANLHPENPIAFAGVMTECGGSDPLPTGACSPQTGLDPGSGACEWSPAIAYNHLLPADTHHALTYATNIQWVQTPSSDAADGANASAPQPCT